MALTDAQKAAMLKYQREATKQIAMRVTLDDMAKLRAYCDTQGIGTTALLRRAVVADMIAHGWTDTISTGKPD